MKITKFDERFFESTRGRVVTLLRGSASTVNELAAALGLTDNAVRAHLLSLERDGLVRQKGTQAGVRKPHFAYELTEEAERLFPKAYDLLLSTLITVLKGKVGPGVLESLLREVGRSLAEKREEAGSLEQRLERALVALDSLGGAAFVERDAASVTIRSNSCPLAEVVAIHPDVCRLAESMLAEIVHASVTEQCDRGSSPRCRFLIAAEPS